MPRYEIVGPDGRSAGTASDLEKAKEIAAHATKVSNAKHTVRDTAHVSVKNSEVLQKIARVRRGGGGGIGIINNKIR